MFARLTVDLSIARSVVTVPESAVAFALHGDTVYVVNDREKPGELLAEPRIVETGPARNGRIAILKGIKSGDKVVTVGQNKLYRGARVELDDTVYF
jgi:membrane fusion protein (multidrug efflux system)